MGMRLPERVGTGARSSVVDEKGAFVRNTHASNDDLGAQQCTRADSRCCASQGISRNQLQLAASEDTTKLGCRFGRALAFRKRLHSLRVVCIKAAADGAQAVAVLT